MKLIYIASLLYLVTINSSWAQEKAAGNIDEPSEKLTQTLTTGGIPSDKAMSDVSDDVLKAASNGEMVARADTPETKLGKQEFEYWCSTCHDHQLFERGMLPGTASLAIKYKGEKPAALEHREDLTRAYVEYVIRNGSEGMPFFRKTEVSDSEMVAIAAYLAPNDDARQKAMKSHNKHAAGAEIFETECIACHGANLEGGVGASLVLEETIHGSSEAELTKSIMNGYGAKGMPAFSATLSEQEIKSVVEYILSRRQNTLKKKTKIAN